MSGTIPFPSESDEEIVDRVTAGRRPEWPSNNPSKLLRKQIEASWNQEPNERPAAFKVLRTLLTLDEAQHQKSTISVQDLDDEVTVGEQGRVNSDPGEGGFLDRL